MFLRWQMIRHWVFTLLALVCFGALSAQTVRFSVSGTIRDALSGEDLPGATLQLKSNSAFGVSTNAYGYYSLQLLQGDYVLIYSYIGYRSVEIDVHLLENIVLNIELEPAAKELNEVEVISQREDANVRANEMAVASINVKEIESIPVLFGEKDVLKTLQLMPGIKPAGEGSSGFYVRGGSSDENLILLDEAPVYSASHMLGFFSIFNSNALRDVKLFKGGMGAEYERRECKKYGGKRRYRTYFVALNH